MIAGDRVSSSGRINYEGRMIYETKNMIYIDGKDGIKMVPKRDHVFLVNGRTINGLTIMKRPWERLSK